MKMTERMSEAILLGGDENRAKATMNPREARQARECALRALFQLDMAGGDTICALDYAMSAEVAGEVAQASIEYAKKLLEGVLAEKDQIDSTITRISKDWSLDRMAFTDRNIMRIAVYEMTKMDGMSLAVAINEAIELGKVFGSEDSPRFINGIVGKLAEELKTK
jgi:N utilization substance protein B